MSVFIESLLRVASDARRAAVALESRPEKAFQLIADLALALASVDATIVHLATPIERKEGRTPKGRKSTKMRPTYVYRCSLGHTFDHVATASRSRGRGAVEWFPSNGYCVCPVCHGNASALPRSGES